MSPKSVLACLPILLIAALTPAGAVSSRFNPKTMIPTSEIHKGMKAVGKSVFSGTTITDFNLEVIGVLSKADLGKDLVMAKILDGPCVERKTGIIGGMSGSPVYIGGRLVGAIAYGWNFSREPIAGITAIDAMLQCLDEPAKQEALSPFATSPERYASVLGDIELDGKRISQVKVVPRSEAGRPFADDHTMLMARVAPPVFCAGLPPAAMEHLKQILKPYGVEPTPGPGLAHEIVPVDLVPGAAFGSTLASGDFDISTGGTITYRDGDLILGFGHPFMELGNIQFPLTTSWVHDFIPCYSRTDKLMSPMQEIGTLTQDRTWSVGGKLGALPMKVPATFKITDETRNLTRTYHVDIMKQRELTPELLAECALSAVMATYNGSGEGMVHVNLKVNGAKGQQITREDNYYHQGMLDEPVMGALAEAMSILVENRFRPQEITSLEYEARLSNRNNAASIESIYADQTVAKAGEKLTLHVRLRPDGGALTEKTVTLPVPLDLDKGRLRIGVAGGTDAMHLRARLGIMPPTFYTLDDLIGLFQHIERGNQLFIAAGIPGKDIAIQGTRLAGLPPSFLSLFKDAPRTDVLAGGGEVSQTLDVPWVVYGAAQMTIDIEDREGRHGKTATTTSKTSTSHEDEEGAHSLPLARGVPSGLWWAASAFAVPASDAGPQPRYSDLPFFGADTKDTDKPAKTEKKKAAKDKDKDKEAEEEGGEKDEDKSKANDKQEGAVGRKPLVWTQSTQEQFAAGEPHGIAIRSDGAVELTPEWQKQQQFDQLYVSALAAAGDVVYAGTMNPGCIYRLKGKERELVFDTGEFGVTMLLADKSGDLFAATLPHGRIFRIPPDGKGKEFCHLPADHVWDVVSDGAGGLYAGVGPGAAVYHIDKQGAAEKLVTIRQGAVTRLLPVGDSLYIGTSQKGALYRLSADHRLYSVYDAGKSDVMALAAGAQGAVLVGTAPEAKVISVDSKGTPTTMFQVTDSGVLALAQAQGRILAGLADKGKIVEVLDRDTNAVLRDNEDCQITALCAAGSKVYAACANPGRILMADFDAPAKGKLESDVLDAKRKARWGRVDWQAAVPEAAGLSVCLRAGSSSDPLDGSWSAWSAPVTEPGREKVSAPTGQFLQYRIEMTKTTGTSLPRLDWLRITYLPADQTPTIKDAKPEEGGAISGKFKLTWKMEDPDKDKLQAKLLARLRGKRDYKTIKEGITKSEFEWDTKSMDEGVYDLRLVVDDSLSNPSDPEEAHFDIANVTIDNTPPEVELISGPAQQTDGGYALTGFALDASSIISSISWQAKGDDTWHAARLDDGLYDWRYERFLITTPPLKETVESITIRARDAAGNFTDKVVKLPKTEKPAATEKPATPDKAATTEKPATPVKPATTEKAPEKPATPDKTPAPVKPDKKETKEPTK